MLVDISTNILNDIDDLKTFELIKTYKDYNVEFLFATPTFDFDVDSYKKFLKQRSKSYAKLNKFIEKSKLEFKVLLGAKIKYTSNLDYYDLDLLTLQKTNYLLIELSKTQFPIDLFSTFSKLKAKGYQIILVNVESCLYLFENYQLINNLVALDVLFMLKSQSILNGDKNAFRLLKSQAVDFIVSDVDGLKTEKFMIENALKYLALHYPKLDLKNIKANYRDLLYNKWAKNVGEVDYA